MRRRIPGFASKGQYSPRVTNRPSSYDAFPLPEDPSLRGASAATPPVGPPDEPAAGAPTGPPPGPPRRPKRRRRVVRAIVITLVMVLVAGGGYAFYNYQRFINGVSHVDAIPEGTGDDFDGTAQNILLVGDDHRPDGATAEDLAKLGTEDDGGGSNTDTVMLLHVPADGSTASLISFPRDSWVDVPGHGKNKLNSAFALGGGNDDPSGGAQLLITVIQNMTGLTVDHYVRVSMLGFYNIVDALGPVEVCLNNAVKDSYSAVDLPAGVSSLNAQQALSFVRQRHGLPNGDLDRQVRQQYFLSVEARQILSAGTLLNPVKLGNVLDAVSGAIETDPGLNFIDLAAQLRGLNADNITSATIPVRGTPTITVNGSRLSIVEVDFDAMPAFIQKVLGIPSAYESAVAAAPGEVTVTVLNGGAANGAAGAATETLASFGFVGGTPGSASWREATTIQYPAGQEAAAKAVAPYLPGAAVVETADVTGVTVVLGSDGQAPAPIAAAAPAAPVEPAPEAPAPEGTTYAAGACIN
jgi:LCP family protein required for cell wall assembly